MPRATETLPQGPMAPTRKSLPKRPAAPAEQGEDAAPAAAIPLAQHPFVWAAAGAVLLFASLPPLAIWPLAFVAIVPWLWMCQSPVWKVRRPYLAIYLAGVGFWLATLHWLRFPHIGAAIGWWALSFYLAAYPVLFVAATRIAVHRYRIPLMVAAPLAWWGLEWLRNHALSGFGMAGLSHALAFQPYWIQIADLGGSYLLSAVLVFLMAAIATAWPVRGGNEASHDKRRWIAPLCAAAAVVALVLGYGEYRLREGNAIEAGSPPGLRAALVQGNIPETIPMPEYVLKQILPQYDAVSQQAAQTSPDLIIWPETMYRANLVRVAPGTKDFAHSRYTVDQVQNAAFETERRAMILVRRYGRPVLLGVDVFEFGHDEERHYNSGVLIDPQAGAQGRYDKIHRVMFGEYIPFGETFPWLYKLSPMAGGLDVGRADQPVIEAAGAKLAVNVCYESSVPHLIREQVRRETAAGRSPDVIVNLTNDGWFRGSSELDLHLACGIFRAVECRKPFLAAANTGLSTHIDSSGRARWIAPRLATATHTADVHFDRRISPYLLVGDWPAAGWALACAVLLLSEGWKRRRTRGRSATAMIDNATSA